MGLMNERGARKGRPWGGERGSGGGVRRGVGVEGEGERDGRRGSNKQSREKVGR